MTEEKVPRRKAEKEEIVEAAAPVVVAKRITFEQWAASRKIRPQHMRGMKAHVSKISRPRTAAEWDAAFANY